MSDSLWPHGLQHTRLLCLPLLLGVCSISCRLSQCCYLIISSPATPFFFCLQSFSVSGSFPVSWFFASGGQITEVSTSAWVLSVNIQDWFPLELTDLISLLSEELSKIFSNNTVQKHEFFSAQPSLWFNTHIHTWLLAKA